MSDVEAASDEEVIAALEELLSAERAGAQVAARTSREMDDGAARDLMIVVHHDEVKWCEMLMRQLKRLGHEPGTDVGAFYEKAMNIDDHDHRMIFLNRGQDWVVRRLDGLMPRVDDNELFADLDDMRRAHIENIEETERLLETRRG